MATEWERIAWDWSDDTVGTSLQGFIQINALQLNLILGDPDVAPDSMQMIGVSVTWWVRFQNDAGEDPFVCSVYSDDRDPVDRWRVGGHDTRALLAIAELLETEITKR